MLFGSRGKPGPYQGVFYPNWEQKFFFGGKKLAKKGPKIADFFRGQLARPHVPVDIIWLYLTTLSSQLDHHGNAKGPFGQFTHPPWGSPIEGMDL